MCSMQSEKQTDKTQVKLIHIAKTKLGLSDEQYRSIMIERYPGCFGSCKDLTYDEATDLINHFKSLGFKIITKKHGKKPTAPNMVQLVSPQQLAKIEHLKQDIRWHVHDGYLRWIKKYLKRDHITTSKEANNVIEALKGMLARQQRAAEPEAECYRDGHVRGGGKWQW